jgi:hypothetical protein
MIDTLKIYEDLQETMDAAAARKIAGVIGMVYEKLQNTVTKKEFGELHDTVKELAEAQKRTELRMEELSEAQKKLTEAQQRTEHRVEELAEAQARTEAVLQDLIKAHRNLVKAHDETNKQLGGLSADFGHTLENEAYKALPKLLKRDHGVLVKGRLKREYVKDKAGEYIEVNISGLARQNGKELVIVGESKSKLSKNKERVFSIIR